MKKFIFIFAVITLFSCSKNDEAGSLGSIIDAYVDFSIFNAQNEDLLNPDTPNYLNSNDIKIFYVIDGKKQEFYKDNLDNPKGYFIGEQEGIYYIRIFLNYEETEEKPITYVQWGNTDTDTIQVLYKRPQNSILQDVIWLNGKQIWERGDNTTPSYFILEK